VATSLVIPAAGELTFHGSKLISFHKPITPWR
jgi:hypothetical protein